jgi:hypothetical protein
MFKNVVKKIILLLSLSVFILGFTWQGEINPNDFVKWEVTGVTNIPVEKELDGFIYIIPLLMVIHNNPEKNSDIKNIKAFYVERTLISYHYFKNEEPFEFVFNIDKNLYEKTNLTQGNKNECINCHKLRDNEKARERNPNNSI